MVRFPGMRGVAVGVCLCVALGVAPAARAGTIVHFETSLGNFDVELYDTAAPITVANFLNYVVAGAYENSFVHRSAPGFVIQGGGFTYDVPQREPVNFPAIPTNPPIVNEFDPSRSNIRGTIAMAKTSDPNSATSQFFFNLADNSTWLDDPNNSGGFAVFGHVLGDGMDVVDAIAEVATFDFTYGTNKTFAELPCRNYTYDDWNTYVPVSDNHVVFMNVTLPEPGALALLATGGVALLRRRRRD